MDDRISLAIRSMNFVIVSPTRTPLYSVTGMSVIHFEATRADDLFPDAPRSFGSLSNMVHAVY